MHTCDRCGIAIPTADAEAITVIYAGRTIRLCRDHARVVVAMLDDLQLDPPLRIIR